MRVPDDIHERVLGLTTDILNTWEPDYKRARWRIYGELRDYCESVAITGRDHPFLWETLADFTVDDRTAIDIYARALALAIASGASEYEASILFALAERHSNLGEVSVAYDYAFQANERAMRTDDLDLRRDISQFLLDHSGVPTGNLTIHSRRIRFAGRLNSRVRPHGWYVASVAHTFVAPGSFGRGSP